LISVSYFRELWCWIAQHVEIQEEDDCADLFDATCGNLTAALMMMIRHLESYIWKAKNIPVPKADLRLR
jgi:hypothetical protein